MSSKFNSYFSFFSTAPKIAMSESQENSCNLVKQGEEENDQLTNTNSQDNETQNNANSVDNANNDDIKPADINQGSQLGSAPEGEPAPIQDSQDDHKSDENIKVVGNEDKSSKEPNQTTAETQDDVKSEEELKEEMAKNDTDDKLNNKSVSVGTVTTLPISETQEVSSSINGKTHRSAKSRRSSYQSGRAYSGSFQNYGLAYLPYKSNFEPSEDARRKADEFFKTLKL